MIIDWLWSLLAALITPLLNALPTWEGSIPLGGTAWIQRLDDVIPIVGPLELLAGFLLFLSPLLVWKAFVYIWRLIPGKAS